MSTAAVDDPIARDLAIVLRWYPVTDSSRVVVWFTRHHGRVSTLIKGSQRPKSWVLGQYDLFYTCELLFYRHAREDLHNFKECAPLQRRAGLRSNWRGCAAASHVADFLFRATPPLAICETLFDLTTQMLDELAAGASAPALLFWFELQALKDMGFAPDLSAPLKEHPVFHYEEGRIRDAGQQGQHDGHHGTISGGVLAILRRLLDESDPARLRRLRLTPPQITELATHLERFTTWHLELRLPARAYALELMLRPAS